MVGNNVLSKGELAWGGGGNSFYLEYAVSGFGMARTILVELSSFHITQCVANDDQILRWDNLDAIAVAKQSRGELDGYLRLRGDEERGGGHEADEVGVSNVASPTWETLVLAQS